MSVTKTRVILTANGERTRIIEEDGQQSTISAADLSPSTTYTVSAEIDDTNYGTVVSTNTMSFNTLAAGTLTLSNVAGTWQTTTAQLNFSASWATTYNLNQVPNMKVQVSKTSDFSYYQEVSPSYVNYGVYGTVSANLTAYLPMTPAGSYYYVRVMATDIYGEILFSPVQTFQLPTNGSCGDPQYFHFSTHEQANKYTYWLPTSITPSQFTYYPYRKYIVYSTNNWVTESKTANYNYPNNVEIFQSFEPNDYALELVCMDIYGELFRTNQGTTISITVPRAYFGDTTRGSAYYWIRVNPNLNYSSVEIQWHSTDGQGFSGSEELTPLSSYDQIRGEIRLDNGDYEFVVVATYTGETSTSETVNVTVTNVGWLDLDNKTTFDDDETMHWSAAFDSEYPLVNDCILTLYDENDSEIGQYQVTYDTEVTNGIMYVEDDIGTSDYSYIWCSVTVDDDEGNNLYAELTLKEEE